MRKAGFLFPTASKRLRDRLRPWPVPRAVKDAMMPRGYFFGEFEITDPAAYEIYRTEVHAPVVKP